MSTNLNVIALISGGKDSIYSIYHCRAKGHKVVALANLFPPSNGQDGEDIDSFMYQTVGHTIIPLYERAFQIPLFRACIQGTAVNTDKYYHPLITGLSTGGCPLSDEIESLFHLLETVKTAHPEANAVSTGAILSDYQRTRVESVALRLGLQPLAYLWQYPYLPPHTHTSLLEHMEAMGHKAVIIKVASGGLRESFLGQNVADSRTIAKLSYALERFGPLQGGSVLGEGGEYETLSVHGPPDLWRESLEIDPEETGIIIGEGGTAVLGMRPPKFVDHDDVSRAGRERLRIPEGLDAEFQQLKEGFEVSLSYEEGCARREGPLPSVIEAGKQFSVYYGERTLCINNLTAPTNDPKTNRIEGQIIVIIDRLTVLLNENSLSSVDVTSSTLILRSMKDFQSVNAVYGAFFSKPLPPSRVTVACGSRLPTGIDVTLSVTVNKLGSSLRRGLHVQSISYWAPANIGPYSQAIGIGSQFQSRDGQRTELVYMAGQIPLIPATMQLVNDGKTLEEFKEQTVLSLQHLWRVGRAMFVDNWLVGIAFIASPSQSDESMSGSVQKLAKIATDAWETLYAQAQEVAGQDEQESQDEVDVWDRRYGLSREVNSFPDTADTRYPLPNLARVEWRARTDFETSIQRGVEARPPCFVFEVDELPRGARIEWTSLGLVKGDMELGLLAESRQLVPDSDLAENELGSLKGPGVEYCSCRIKQTGDLFVWIGIDDIKETSVEALCREFLQDGTVLSAFTVYTAQDLPKSSGGESVIQVIPCKSVWSYGGKRLAAMLSFKIEGKEKDTDINDGI